MSATVYLGRAALDQIDAAQAVVDQHLIGSGTGMCRTCQVESPCVPLLEAVAALDAYGRLPQRRPGVTQLAQARRKDHFGWF